MATPVLRPLRSDSGTHRSPAFVPEVAEMLTADPAGGDPMGFVDSLQLKGRVVDIYMANGITLDGARVKNVSPSMIQVTYKDRTRYLNPEYIIMIEVG